ncbi:MAG: protein-S-isoprenylcysteine O-methyltransferase, partial [Verrucomicrobiota bacterium]
KKRTSGMVDCGLFATGGVMILGSFLWLFTPKLAFADYELHPLVFFVGTALLLLGLGVIWRSHRDLGKNFSKLLEVHQNHQLVTDGIYRHVRHPMYSGLFLFSLGHALVIPNVLAGPAMMVGLSPLIAYRLHAEERMLAEHFGDAYVAYQRKTKRIFPGIY